MKSGRFRPILVVGGMVAVFAFLNWFFSRPSEQSAGPARVPPVARQREAAAPPARQERSAQGVGQAGVSPGGSRMPAVARNSSGSAVLLQQEDGPVGADGSFVRRRLLRTEKKYPLVRVDEKMEPDSTGGWRVASRTAWVADHVLVRLQPGYSRQDLLRAARAHGGEIRKAVGASFYLVSFEGSELRALERFSEGFKRESAVVIVEPDYLVRASR